MKRRRKSIRDTTVKVNTIFIDPDMGVVFMTTDNKKKIIVKDVQENGMATINTALKP